MNLSDRLKAKGIVSNELLGGKFDRMATYRTDGTLLIEATPDFAAGNWVEAQQVILQNWEEICRLRDFLNGLTPVDVPQKRKEEPHDERASA
ncbi:hypothetical protein [Brevibacillus sp. 1238]|uniref:hypothetical protein n=1 Tax=Brevibacillus sp. 1238 TaxID=2940565 RepID=UPI00247608F6|nr:hypothetical protein [Brevibacillus sp. 1238]MDH6351886.1 hypothetical protein [Brevibacillus sp. 1238]